MKTQPIPPTLYTLQTFVLRNHNGHRLIVLKRGRHTVRLQYDEGNRTGSVWAVIQQPASVPRNEGGFMPQPLVIRFRAGYREAIERLVEMELALYDQERLADGMESIIRTVASGNEVPLTAEGQAAVTRILSGASARPVRNVNSHP